MQILALRDAKEICESFLFCEAELLDDRKFLDWLDRLHPDLTYQIPVRISTSMEQLDDEFSIRGFHMRETFGSLKMRIHRLYTEHAYAENPPSRTTRIVSNVRPEPLANGQLRIRSNFLLYRSYGDKTAHDVLAGERRDRLASTADGWKLVQRDVLLAHSAIPSANLGVFL